MDRVTAILAQAGAHGRAQQLRAQGYSPAEAAAELAWELELEVEKLRLANGTGAASSDSQGARSDEPMSGVRLGALTRDRDMWRLRAEEAEAKLANAEAELREQLVSGKRFQTLLKIAYVKAHDLGFDPSRNNHAATDFMKILADHEIQAEDREAFRFVWKAAFERKEGGYWKLKPQK